MFLLALPTSASIAVVIIAASLFSTALYFVVHPFWAKDLSDDTQNTANLVAVRLGVVYAIVIGMMFTNVRMEHQQMVQAVENEASALTSFYRAIERTDDKNALKIHDHLIAYIEFIVNEQWPALRHASTYPEERFIKGAKNKLKPVWEYVEAKEKEVGHKNLSRLLYQVEHYHTIRLYDFKGNVLPLFWYIATFGCFATLVTLCVLPPNFRRCTLVSLYSSMVAVVLLGIFVMSHPYSTAAGVEPNLFKWMLGGPP